VAGAHRRRRSGAGARCSPGAVVPVVSALVRIAALTALALAGLVAPTFLAYQPWSGKLGQMAAVIKEEELDVSDERPEPGGPPLRDIAILAENQEAPFGGTDMLEEPNVFGDDRPLGGRNREILEPLGVADDPGVKRDKIELVRKAGRDLDDGRPQRHAP
jgi:hypothetical protein